MTGPNGTYKIGLTVNDSSVYFADRERPAAAAPESGQPSFRSFSATFNILLRDGQTAQYTTATDQVSGEVIEIDATMTVPEVGRSRVGAARLSPRFRTRSGCWLKLGPARNRPTSGRTAAARRSCALFWPRVIEARPGRRG